MASGTMHTSRSIRKWLRPGIRFLVAFPEDEWEHERVFLWPIDANAWSVLTGDGVIAVESLLS